MLTATLACKASLGSLQVQLKQKSFCLQFMCDSMPSELSGFALRKKIGYRKPPDLLVCRTYNGQADVVAEKLLVGEKS